MSKLTEEDVLNIKKLLLKNKTQRSIAKTYNVHYSTISKIKRNKSWSWLN